MVVAAWGFWQWNRGRQQTQDGSIAVRFATWRERGALLAAAAVGTLAVGGLFTAYPTLSWDPWPDAYIFVGTVVAMYAQARGMVEFWFALAAGRPGRRPAELRQRLRLLRLRLRHLRRARPVGPARLVAALPYRARAARPGSAERPHEHRAPILYSTDGYEDLALDPVEQAVADIAAGRPVVVVDDENRENEGDSSSPPEKATEEIVAFMMSECRGLICAPMEGRRTWTGSRLAADGRRQHRVDEDRLHRLRGRHRRARREHRHLGLDRAYHPPAPGERHRRADRPGPPRLTSSRCAPRSGRRTPSATATPRPPSTLARLAGLRPAGAIRIRDRRRGQCCGCPRLIPFARKHGLTIISIEDLISYRRSEEPTVRRNAEVRLPTRHGEVHGVRLPLHRRRRPSTSRSSTATSATGRTSWSASTPSASPATSSAPSAATAAPSWTPPWTASRPRAGVWSSPARPRGARHRPDVQAARHELRERGRDTLDADLELGLPADARDYGAGAQIPHRPRRAPCA